MMKPNCRFIALAFAYLSCVYGNKYIIHITNGTINLSNLSIAWMPKSQSDSDPDNETIDGVRVTPIGDKTCITIEDYEFCFMLYSAYSSRSNSRYQIYDCIIKLRGQSVDTFTQVQELKNKTWYTSFETWLASDTNKPGQYGLRTAFTKIQKKTDQQTQQKEERQRSQLAAEQERKQEEKLKSDKQKMINFSNRFNLPEFYKVIQSNLNEQYNPLKQDIVDTIVQYKQLKNSLTQLNPELYVKNEPQLGLYTKKLAEFQRGFELLIQKEIALKDLYRVIVEGQTLTHEQLRRVQAQINSSAQNTLRQTLLKCVEFVDVRSLDELEELLNQVLTQRAQTKPTVSARSMVDDLLSKGFYKDVTDESNLGFKNNAEELFIGLIREKTDPQSKTKQYLSYVRIGPEEQKAISMLTDNATYQINRDINLFTYNPITVDGYRQTKIDNTNLDVNIAQAIQNLTLDQNNLTKLQGFEHARSVNPPLFPNTAFIPNFVKDNDEFKKFLLAYINAIESKRLPQLRITFAKQVMKINGDIYENFVMTFGINDTVKGKTFKEIQEEYIKYFLSLEIQAPGSANKKQ